MIPFSAVLLRLILALLLGAVIGAERELRVHEAGLRTMALVSLGAYLFEVISITGFADLMVLPHIQVDPSRVASYVVAGIGFLMCIPSKSIYKMLHADL
jgi:putative Mg2+ transporter-C (MgtC) family protein